jgi:hypothetical protein
VTAWPKGAQRPDKAGSSVCSELSLKDRAAREHAIERDYMVPELLRQLVRPQAALKQVIDLEAERATARRVGGSFIGEERRTFIIS